MYPRFIQGPVISGEGSTHPVESHHTPTSAPSTSQPPISTTSRRIIRQEYVVPQPRSPTQTYVADKAASISVDVRYGGDATIVTGFEEGLGSGAAYTKLIKKVKKLENKVKSNQARRRARIVVSDEEEDLEDTFKQGRKISEIDQDPTISLDVSTAEEDISTAKLVSTVGAAVTTASVDVSTTTVSTAKDNGKAKLEEEERQRIASIQEVASSFNIEEWDDIQARVEADEELAQRLQAEERKKYSEAKKARLLIELINKRKSEIERAIHKSTDRSSKRDAEEELAQKRSKRQKTRESSVSAEEPKDK
ncbi:hypothetical protein Tco_1093873 [Tanacetum coccineum]|uniref:Uncharacterized protein n=1 Tax=Tanacetum coccineum TaxID=301880 RepID=A0ABQ5IF72_9ASTR